MEEITFDYFSKLDIRIGTIVEAEVPEWSHWVMKLKVNLGKEIGEKIIFAGIMNTFKPKGVVGKQAPFIVNLKPKKIGPQGDLSEGMMMLASISNDEGGEEKEKPVFLNPADSVPNGTKVR